MPIDNTHYVVYKIDGNPVIQRYISMEKLVSMLSRNSLFFTRLDKLEDPYEGTSPKIVRKGLRLFYEKANRHFLTNPLDEQGIQKTISDFEAHTERMRALYVVNCWHIRDIENALMWKSYASSNNGVMIRSNYQNLINSFNKTEEKIQVSAVKYRDYENDHTIEFGNGSYPVINKTQFYSDENELRLIYQVSNSGWVHNWQEEESPNGVFLKANMQELIDEIVVAPFAQKWYFDAVQAVCEKFGLNKKVVKSSLAK